MVFLLTMVKKVHAAHILVKDEAQAKSLMQEIKSGGDFGALAKKFSGCPSGKKGGDLGWFGRNEMVPEFEKAAFGARSGDVVGPIKTQFGFHLIKVIDQK
jgi:peptidyl-prolyl cis-trans isomerase C